MFPRSVFHSRATLKQQAEKLEANIVFMYNTNSIQLTQHQSNKAEHGLRDKARGIWNEKKSLYLSQRCMKTWFVKLWTAC